MSGKLKMVLQCLAAGWRLYALYYGNPQPDALAWAVTISIWGAVLLTLYSGVAYIHRAIVLLRG